VVEPQAVSELAPVDDWLSPPQEGPLDLGVILTTEAPAAPLAEAAPAEAEEMLPQGVEGELPGWYTRMVEEPAPAPQFVAPPAPPPPPVQAVPPPPPPVMPGAPVVTVRRVAQPVPPPLVPATIPAGFPEYQTRLEQNPADHATRLNLARDLNNQGDVAASLEQYETLVESTAMLEVVATDLARLIEGQPAHPRARRLLGDTYMRQGRLQEALDTYRGALNQL
jgi:tetratricopeptide (TPR) repeat protein